MFSIYFICPVRAFHGLKENLWVSFSGWCLMKTKVSLLRFWWQYQAHSLNKCCWLDWWWCLFNGKFLKCHRDVVSPVHLNLPPKCFAFRCVCRHIMWPWEVVFFGHPGIKTYRITGTTLTNEITQPQLIFAHL